LHLPTKQAELASKICVLLGQGECKMSNLAVQNTFEPYFAGRNNDNSRWFIRRKTRAAAEQQQQPVEERASADAPTTDQRDA
jgi:hypothetical protein